MTTLRLGTRGSPLALFQARAVAERIRGTGGPPCEIVVIKTSGDRLADASLSEAGGKRLFVKEIEDALLSNTIDVAVHSSKDMPALLPNGLALGAVLPRDNPADALILPASPDAQPNQLDALVTRVGSSPRIGTGSVRRIAQLLPWFPGAAFQPLRGNLETRLRKLDRGEYDLIVLAAAGIRRLGFGHRLSVTLPLSVCVPAPGQGIIAIEVRADDPPVQEAVKRVDDATTAAALDAERALVIELGGGCQMPIGAGATVEDDRLVLLAIVASLDGSRVARCRVEGSRFAAVSLGATAAQELIAKGGLDILKESQGAEATVVEKY